MAVAIAVLVAVGFVMLVVVTDKVIERISVVRRNEVDARVRPAPIVLVKIGAAGQSIRHFADKTFVAAPKTAHGVAKFSVPFRKGRRKIADLITAVANVPWLGD